MFSSTHIYIAEKICKHIKESSGIKIDKTYFTFGSIKPDYAPKLIHIGHYADESMDFLRGEIQLLSSLPFRKDKNFIRQYSIRLGVVSHYLSDYFCHAHNSMAMKSDMPKHLLYEAKLESVIWKFEDSLIKPTTKYISLPFKENIMNYINTMLGSYKNQQITYFNDLKYAIEANNIACSIILNSSLNAAKITAA